MKGSGRKGLEEMYQFSVLEKTLNLIEKCKMQNANCKFPEKNRFFKFQFYIYNLQFILANFSNG